MEITKGLAIGDETFAEATLNFNRALQRTLERMIKAGALNGSVSLKINIEMEGRCVDDYRDNQNQKRDALVPKFSFNVSTTITEKPFEEKGNISPEMEVFFDEIDKKYKLIPITGEAQMNIYDYDLMNPPEEETEEEHEDASDMDSTAFYKWLLEKVGEKVYVKRIGDRRYGMVFEDGTVVYLWPEEDIDLSNYTGENVPMELLEASDGSCIALLELTGGKELAVWKKDALP